MKFADIPAKILTFRVKRANETAGALKEEPVLSVEPCQTRPGEFEIRLKKSVVFVKPVMKTDIQRLNAELADGSAVLAQLANPAADGSAELQTAFFTGGPIDVGGVEIGADEYVERTYGAMTRRKISGTELYGALTKRCCYVHCDQPYFFFFAGPAIDDYLQEDEADEPDLNTANSIQEPPQEASSSHPEPTRKNSFLIVGDGMRFAATERRIPDGKSIYIATRLTEHKGLDRALRLAKGKLSFTDWTQAGQIQMLTKAQMSALTRDNGSYLNRWDKFVDVEGELLLERARKFGALRYSGATPGRDGSVTVRIAEASDSALEAIKEALKNKKDLPVEKVEELPEHINNLALTFAQFVDIIKKEEAKASGNKHRKQRQRARESYDITDYYEAAKELTLRTENLPDSGTLVLSLSGDSAQITRRQAARRAILEGRSANPQLGLLLEGKGALVPTRQPIKIEPLTAFVHDKVFRSPPTAKQKDAIQIALNTPDIAMIQGPPGTGKTTVVAAIVERLNEMADKRSSSFKGSVLLTGFQHDAVENMIKRISINGLPVPKFGKRPGGNEDDFSEFENNLRGWCGDIAAALRDKNPQLAEIERETQIKALCLQYLNAPTRELGLGIVKRIAGLGVLVLGEECARHAARLAEKFSRQELLNAETAPLLTSVRQLRYRPESFADDGPERAADALDDLRDVLKKDERGLLDKASLWRAEDGVPPFLDGIGALKKKLLLRFTAQPAFRVEKQNDEIMMLAEEACKKLRTNGASARDSRLAALAEFLAELEGNPYGMADAVSGYAYAFAATCQYSVNDEVRSRRGENIDDQKQDNPYNYVIVDEAGRVTPLDLMVAMAQGRRIILVGDHRQLPHIIDEAVADKMESGEKGESEAEWLKISMFQYLFSERLKALEEADGIPRRVTLDKQYRMHPLLGDFVSRNFYERFEPSEKFGSGRPESDFAHALPDTDGRQAVWLDVPAAKGIHKRSGTSYIRPAEAAAIARQLRVWMNSEEGRGLSFGVISFYKAQAELIKKELGALTDNNDQLRVGTVDSFQGMEFDAVILSMVRTVRDDWKPNSDDEEKQARGLFGHLSLYNRLNVSMSRQKKLLVVAGDSGLLQSDLSVRYIPGLVDFHNLCETYGKVLPCP